MLGVIWVSEMTPQTAQQSGSPGQSTGASRIWGSRRTTPEAQTYSGVHCRVPMPPPHQDGSGPSLSAFGQALGTSGLAPSRANLRALPGAIPIVLLAAAALGRPSLNLILATAKNISNPAPSELGNRTLTCDYSLRRKSQGRTDHSSHSLVFISHTRMFLLRIFRVRLILHRTDHRRCRNSNATGLMRPQTGPAALHRPGGNR